MTEVAEVAEDLVIDGLNITERVAQIEDQGYTVVPDFIAADEIARIRHAFDTEVHITEMRAIRTKTGKTWRAHNLLAKTRAVDYLFLVVEHTCNDGSARPQGALKARTRCAASPRMHIGHTSRGDNKAGWPRFQRALWARPSGGRRCAPRRVAPTRRTPVRLRDRALRGTHRRPLTRHYKSVRPLDSRIRALVEGVLGKYTQVNVTTLFNVLPGETRQFPHQDDGLWPIARPHPHFVCNALIALDDFDLENGATHIVPYSHKWYDRPVDQSIETTRVTMRSGTMLMWEGGLWHGGGANTSKDRERLGFFMSHNVAYLRPQEIQLLSVPREVVREMPEELQRLLGYHRFGLGVDGRDPVDVLKDGNVIHPTAKLAPEHRN